MSYSSQALIEAFLKRSLTANETTLLTYILEAVDSYINDQIGDSFESETTTKYYDGGTKILEIDACTSITAVKLVDSEENIIETYELNEDFEARPRNESGKTWIESRIGRFPKGVANIAVTATFGLGSVPNDIIYLATYLAGQLLSSQIAGNLKAESIEGYSRTFGEFVENNQVVSMILNKYMKDDILI